MDSDSTPAAPNLPPAAWYRDTADPTLLRWWDGQQWTEHTTLLPSEQPTVVEPTPAPSALAPARSAAVFTAHTATAAAGLVGRMLKRAKADRSSTPPSVEEIVAACRLEDPRYPLGEQIEVTGETYYISGIRRVFAQQGLPISAKGSTLEMMQCCLVPNPWNPHDPNAVAVCVDGHQVGHLPADICLDYAPHLLALARKEVLATGEARLWAKSDGGMVRARVTILIPTAQQLR